MTTKVRKIAKPHIVKISFLIMFAASLICSPNLLFTFTFFGIVAISFLWSQIVDFFYGSELGKRTHMFIALAMLLGILIGGITEFTIVRYDDSIPKDGLTMVFWLVSIVISSFVGGIIYMLQYAVLRLVSKKQQ